MKKIVTVTNQKGGAGKTTTALALSSGLRDKGFRTLMIDLDPQRNLSFSAGAVATGATALGVLTGEVKTADAIQHTENGDIIASSRALSGADAFIIGASKQYKLRKALEAVTDDYDYIIIDTPPALGILTVNAITACGSIVIPVQADIYSLQGAEELCENILPIKEMCNQELTIEGILLTRYSPRSVLSREIAERLEDFAQQNGTKLFKAKIREAIAVKEAQLLRRSIFDHASRSKVAEDYRAFIEELLEGGITE